MIGKGNFRIVALTLVIVGLTTVAAKATPPWVNLVSSSRIEADPKKEYKLSEGNGPWMIMACSFRGEGAQQQAQDLVVELRKRYKLPAYTYKKKFNTDKVQGRGIDRYGEPVKMKYANQIDPEEVAVLVGDYASVDDPEAQKVLKKLKVTIPDACKQKDDKNNNLSLASWREIQKTAQEQLGVAQKDKGPMGHAMIAPNPLLPGDFFVNKGLDPLVVEMNKNVPNSLLDCPGKYTVQVATFKGQVVLKQNEIKAIEDGKKEFKSGLAEAALKAHDLCEALRMKGYDAYEFHDKSASIVTVGSFDSVGTPLPDGRTELNPQILRIMKTFAAEPPKPELHTGQNVLNTPVKSLAGINFDVQPIPVQVPRRSISEAIRARDRDTAMR